MTGNMNVSLLWRKDLSERGHDFFRILRIMQPVVAKFMKVMV